MIFQRIKSLFGMTTTDICQDWHGPRTPGYWSCAPINLQVIGRGEDVLLPGDVELRNSELYQSLSANTLGKDALCKLVGEYKFKTVLDLGAGDGKHCRAFLSHNKDVSAIMADEPEWFAEDLKDYVNLIFDDYVLHQFIDKFDCIWASHVLEHQRNIGLFLDKIWDDLNDGGILAITVPPIEMEAGDGHVNLFSPGHLVSQLLEAGFNMTDMRLKIYGYNLSVICRKDAGIVPRKANFAANRLLFHKAAMPPDLFLALDRFKAEHPSSWGGHERIPLEFEWHW
ncbi:MAG: class I SAM-dependent methyltransferase [Desulfovibrio sp.]|jgi:SAM-dependent methyltransferase|nr:class I SAM-dependent methyltransferase [Desulfovibrio sp.]